MDKAQFLRELSLALEEQNIDNVEDIIAEYDDHFAFKHEDGYSEHETASRLGSPAKIAAQYASFRAGNRRSKRAALLTMIGLALLDVIVAIVSIMVIAWILVMGMFVVLVAALGVFMILNINFAGLISLMPHAIACMLGVACFALAMLVSIVTIYFFTYSAQLIRSYIVWHRRVIRGAPTHPPVSKYLILTVRQRRGLRHTALIALAVFGIAILSSFITMTAAAGFLAPWQAWEWFPRSS